MDILGIVERIGEAPSAALFGLLTGVIFGVAAQRSRFCLRAAAVEFARGDLGPKSRSGFCASPPRWSGCRPPIWPG
jgi:hypothetical protein